MGLVSSRTTFPKQKMNFVLNYKAGKPEKNPKYQLEPTNGRWILDSWRDSVSLESPPQINSTSKGQVNDNNCLGIEYFN